MQHCSLLSILLAITRPTTSASDVLQEDDTASFRYLGQTVTTLGYAHLTFTIHLGPLLLGIDDAQIAIVAARNAIRWHRPHIHWQKELKNHTSDWLAATAQRVHMAQDKLYTAMEAVGVDAEARDAWRKENPAGAKTIQKLRARRSADTSPNPHVRTKRGWWGLLRFAGTTLFGFLSSREVQKVRETAERHERNINTLALEVRGNQLRIDTLGEQVERLQDQTALLRDQARQHQHQLTASALVSTLEEQADILLNVATDLMKGRLHASALSHAAYHEIFKDLQRQVNDSHLKLLIARPTDILQCETEFLAADMQLTVVVRVPTAATDDQLYLYQYLPVPVEITPGVMMTIETPLDVIAGNWHQKDRFRAMTMNDLQRCKRINGYHICDDGNISRKAESLAGEVSAEACIWALFAQVYDMVRTACEFYLRSPANSIIPLGDNNFAAFSIRDIQGSSTCADPELNGVISVTGRYFFTLHPGCTADLQTHEINAVSTFGVPTNQQNWGWKVPIEETFQMTAEEITRIAAAHQDLLEGPGMSRAELWRAYRHEKSTPWTLEEAGKQHSLVHSILLFISLAGVAITLLGALALWFLVRFKGAWLRRRLQQWLRTKGAPGRMAAHFIQTRQGSSATLRRHSSTTSSAARRHSRRSDDIYSNIAVPAPRHSRQHSAELQPAIALEADTSTEADP